MIDAALMRALVDAVRPDARLVVLGDHRQLASVEAGAVLADLCGPSGDEPGSAVVSAGTTAAADATPESPPIAGCIAHLTFSFRFEAGGGIGRLAQAIRAGDRAGAISLLEDPALADVNLVAAPALGADGMLHPQLQALVVAGYGPGLEHLRAPAPDRAAIASALNGLGRFRVLCAHRRGRAGVARLGPAVVAALADARLIAPTGEHWAGRLVLVTRNDPALGIFNGDVGLVAQDPELGGRERVFFPGPDGLPRPIAPPRLPPHETSFAMTIHKSQGSEFDRVAVVLPEVGSPLLTRELLYTAVTRARSGVTVFATPEAIAAAIGRRAERASGLRQRLWGA